MDKPFPIKVTQLDSTIFPEDDSFLYLVIKENEVYQSRKISALDLKSYFYGSRTDKSSSTEESINNGVSSNLLLPSVAKTYSLVKISTNVPAWVTLYLDESSRTNDSSRNEGTDPPANSGIMAEVTTGVGNLDKIFTPSIVAWSLDGNVYARVLNKSGSSSVVTVTLTYLVMET